MAPPFITFEGGEGVGKSTHVALLGQRLRGLGRGVTETREPGGSPAGELVRGLLVRGEIDRWSADAEALLNYAARDAHLRTTIRPALERGDIVLCDRFLDSTRAYQGYAGGCNRALLAMLEQAIVAESFPTLTLIFDLAPEVGLARAGRRDHPGENRFERKGIEFHRRLREGFLTIAQAEPGRCRRVDASGSIEETQAAIWREVEPLVA